MSMSTAVVEPKPFATPLAAVNLESETFKGDILVMASTEVRADAPYLVGHFPEKTLFPGVFVIELVRWCISYATAERLQGAAELLSVDSVRFMKPLQADDQVILSSTIRTAEDDGTFRVDAVCRCAAGSRTAAVRAVGGWPTWA